MLSLQVFRRDEAMMSNQIGNIWGDNPDKFHGLAYSVVTRKGEENGGNCQ